MDLGDELGPLRRTAPQAAQIEAYFGAAVMKERIFSDAVHATRLGFRGIVVPGPMLAALLEEFLRRQLPDWHVEIFSTTFRMPTIAGDTISLRGLITEHHRRQQGERLVCDLMIEHESGEVAVIGTATLRQGSR